MLGCHVLGPRGNDSFCRPPNIPMHAHQCHLAILGGRIPRSVPLLRRQRPGIRRCGLLHRAGHHNPDHAAAATPGPPHQLASQGRDTYHVQPGHLRPRHELYPPPVHCPVCEEQEPVVGLYRCLDLVWYRGRGQYHRDESAGHPRSARLLMAQGLLDRRQAV